MKEQRRAGLQRARWLLVDVKRWDRKQGLVGDLDKEFVEAAVETACTYCGETELMMTLDRIDNSIGHLKSNVVPACLRCNYLRRDMPYTAWYALLPAIRAAREAGLFGTWTGAAHNRNGT